MANETMRVTPVTPHVGADVDGISLSKPLSNREVEDLHQALVEHQVLFFRDQPLDVESHKALGRCFGELHSPQHARTGRTSGDLADPR